MRGDVALPKGMDRGRPQGPAPRRRRDGAAHPLQEGRWPGPFGDRAAASRRCLARHPGSGTSLVRRHGSGSETRERDLGTEPGARLPQEEQGRQPRLPGSRTLKIMEIALFFMIFLPSFDAVRRLGMSAGSAPSVPTPRADGPARAA